MKRAFDEISDEEWENHSSFKPSKFLNSSSSSKPPHSIESFAFTSRSAPIDLTDDGDEDYVPPPDDVEDLEDDDDDLEDHDADVAAISGRRGRFLVDDKDDMDNNNNDDDLQEVVEVKSEVEEEEEEEMESLSDTDDDEDDDEDEKLEKEEEDVVGRALQKCAKISAELRKELNGPSVTVADRYAESGLSF